MCLCVCAHGDCVSKRQRTGKGGEKERACGGVAGGCSLAVLVAINHLGAPYPLTFARV